MRTKEEIIGDTGNLYESIVEALVDIRDVLVEIRGLQKEMHEAKNKPVMNGGGTELINIKLK